MYDSAAMAQSQISRGHARQRLLAARNLQPTRRIDKRKLLADPTTQSPTAAEFFLRKDRNASRACRLAAQAAANLRL